MYPCIETKRCSQISVMEWHHDYLPWSRNFLQNKTARGTFCTKCTPSMYVCMYYQELMSAAKQRSAHKLLVLCMYVFPSHFWNAIILYVTSRTLVKVAKISVVHRSRSTIFEVFWLYSSSCCKRACSFVFLNTSVDFISRIMAVASTAFHTKRHPVRSAQLSLASHTL